MKYYICPEGTVVYGRKDGKTIMCPTENEAIELIRDEEARAGN